MGLVGDVDLQSGVWCARTPERLSSTSHLPALSLSLSLPTCESGLVLPGITRWTPVAVPYAFPQGWPIVGLYPSPTIIHLTDYVENRQLTNFYAASRPVWFKALVGLEVAFELPFFFAALYALRTRSKLPYQFHWR